MIQYVPICVGECWSRYETTLGTRADVPSERIRERRAVLIYILHQHLISPEQLTCDMDVSDLDGDLIGSYQRRHGCELDIQTVSDEIEHIIQNPDSWLQYVSSSDNNKQAAVHYMLQSENFGSGSPSIINMAFFTFCTGCQILDLMDKYHIFEPCIKRMLRMDGLEMEGRSEFHYDYMKSNYEKIISQSYNKINITEEIGLERNADSIKRGIEDYSYAMGIIERGFPLLLGVKRIIDDKVSPDLDTLQNLKLSSISRELTNRSSKSYAYFDQIVNAVDIDLRNGIAHGDIMIDPSDSTVKIPNNSIEYSFSETVDSIEKTIAVSVFLSGVFQSTFEMNLIIEATESDISDFILL